MSTDTKQRVAPDFGNARPISAPARPLPLPRLNPKCLGLGFGATGVVFYLGCILTMATVPHEQAVLFFNSLLHGLDVEPILKTSVPVADVALGLVTTFILGWFAGVLIAGFYNLSLHTRK
jgi:hypothetical protein